MAERRTRVVTLAGSAKQRGEAYGESLRDLVAEAADRWSEHIARSLAVPLPEYLIELDAHSGFRAAVSAHCPELLEEIAGLAQASGVPEQTLFAMNLLDEEWWMRRRFRNGDGPTAAMAHCSGFGIPPTDGRPAYVGQNMDLPGWMDGLQILIELRPDDGPDALIPSWPGMVALDGVNEHGVGVCVNTLAQLPTSTTGVPVAFAIRMVLAQPDRAHALAMLHGLPHASGQNYVLGDPTGVSDVECSAAGAAEYAPATKWFAHTNHPLADPEQADGKVPDNGSSDLSVIRHTHLSQRLDALTEIHPEQLGRVLAEPPLCRGTDGDPGFTLYAAVMELTDNPVLHLSAGPPSDHPLVAFEVSGS